MVNNTNLCSSQNNGYLVKLYKKMINAPKKAFISGAMYMTWLNFDCMDIIPVQEFPQYNNSIDIMNVQDREKYGCRQKLFLYCLDGAEEDGPLVQRKEGVHPPLITLTVLDLLSESGDFPTKNKILSCLEACKKEEQYAKVEGRFYGCLSMYDYALVLRGNNYEQLSHFLALFRRKAKEQGIIFNKMYSVAGIDLEQGAEWKCEPSRALVRLSCTSELTAKYLLNSEELGRAFVKPFQVYAVMGKYDYNIEGMIQDTKAFQNLFVDKGFLSATHSYIHKTNTQFLSGEKEQDKAEGTTGNFSASMKKDRDEEWKDYKEKYEKLDSLPPSIKESLVRLIFRFDQAISTIKKPTMITDLNKILNNFLLFLQMHQKETERQDVFGRMINDLNLLLDNWTSVDMTDFETPQKTLRYSGSSLKVLLSYSNFVQKLIKILQYNKPEIEYVPYVTTDTGAKITATIYLSYCKKYRFININIPVDLMFEMQDVLPWLTHEVGHFLRAGWERNARNAAYRWSVIRVMISMFAPYVNSDFMGQGGAGDLFAQTSAGNEKFDAYRKQVCQELYDIIIRSGFGYKKQMKIPYNRMDELYQRTVEIAEILQKTYEESIADIFMIQVLGIEKIRDYLRIQVKYYKHINVGSDCLPLANISRIMAVCVTLANLKYEDYNEINCYFAALYDTCEDKDLLPIIRQLAAYKRYYMIEPLVRFIKVHVEPGLEQLISEENLAKLCNELKTGYEALQQGEFEEYLQFIVKSLNESKDEMFSYGKKDS